MKKINKKDFLLIVVSLCLIIGGVYSACSPFLSKFLINNQVKKEVETTLGTTSQEIKINSESKDSGNTQEVIKNSSSNEQENNTSENKEKEVEPLTVEELLKNRVENKKLNSIGVIAIPSVSIELPILKGVTYENMMYGAGTAKDNEVMGERNFSLASHSIYNSYNENSLEKNLLFGNLVDVKAGELIYITNKINVYKYVIDKIYKVNETQSDILNDNKNKNEITLYTCTSLKSKTRLVVHGNLKEITSYKENNHIF